MGSFYYEIGTYIYYKLGCFYHKMGIYVYYKMGRVFFNFNMGTSYTKWIIYNKMGINTRYNRQHKYRSMSPVLYECILIRRVLGTCCLEMYVDVISISHVVIQTYVTFSLEI